MPYEDAELRVFWHPGTGRDPRLLITFGDLVSLRRPHSFFAEAPVRKAGLACLGFVARTPNWYLPGIMEPAWAAVDPLLRPFVRRMTYGGSMGGYAAIRHSRRLGATEVLALCPQWSLDPAECEGHRPGYVAHFRPAMRGMGIRTQHVSGRVTVLADLGDRGDAGHAALLSRHVPGLRVVGVPMAGHHVTAILAGTDNLLGLVAACAAPDDRDLGAVVQTARRASPVRARNLLAAAIRRRPAAAARLARHERMGLDGSADHVRRLHAPLVAALMRAGRADAAAEHARWAAGLAVSPEDAATLRALAGLPEPVFEDAAGELAADRPIRTVHGTILVFDPGARRLRHVPPADAAGMPRVLLSGGATARLCVEGAKGLAGLAVDPTGFATVRPAIGSPGVTAFRVGPAAGAAASVVLRGPGGYLCAARNGSVSADRGVARAWETFRLA
ncbi:hypothetical protein [Muricoccus radiodurans]|uniref:hypothetical protein n=1 Tax=Muricoccus radiodurans TaxID=2231721 RepID=UPI003CEA2A1E